MAQTDAKVKSWRIRDINRQKVAEHGQWVGQTGQRLRKWVGLASRDRRTCADLTGQKCKHTFRFGEAEIDARAHSFKRCIVGEVDTNGKIAE